MYDLSYTEKHNSICLILFTIIFLTNDEKSSNGEKARKNVNLTHFSKFSEYTFIWMVFGLRWSMSTMVFFLKKQNLNKINWYKLFVFSFENSKRNSFETQLDCVSFGLVRFVLLQTEHNFGHDILAYLLKSLHLVLETLKKKNQSNKTIDSYFIKILLKFRWFNFLYIYMPKQLERGLDD